MMKFASFENIVAAMWAYLPGTKDDYGKGAQTAVAFSGGYLAGILCAIVSHPADVMVSKLNAERAPGEAFGGALSRIYSKIGFAGLWNGLPVRIVMIGTLTGLQVSVTDLSAHMAANVCIVDDLRLLQALRWLAYHWLFRSTKGDCQSVNVETSAPKRLMVVCAYEIDCLGLKQGLCFEDGVVQPEIVLNKIDCTATSLASPCSSASLAGKRIRLEVLRIVA